MLRYIKHKVVNKFSRHILDYLERASKVAHDSEISVHSRIYSPYQILDTRIGDYSYISTNSKVSFTTIGKYCSIGPNFLCGWGVHPLDSLSTSPMFYSTKKQNGVTLCDTDLFTERLPITIGNDVFIGMNVTVLDGVSIGDGAVIGAGSVVSKDIPPYAIAYGNPIKVHRFRFSKDIISQLLDLKWWNRPLSELKGIVHTTHIEESIAILSKK